MYVCLYTYIYIYIYVCIYRFEYMCIFIHISVPSHTVESNLLAMLEK